MCSWFCVVVRFEGGRGGEGRSEVGEEGLEGWRGEKIIGTRRGKNSEKKTFITS